MSWLPQLVGVMWEVLQQLRCDRQPLSPARRGVELHTAKVPTPTLARQHCRWCQILEQKEEQEEEEEESVYETVELARVEVRTDSASLERTYSVVRQRNRRIERERERTYGEVREREGRTRERQEETDWRGRSPGRRWRGRSSSSLRWEGGQPGESGGWRGRVVSGEFVVSGRGPEWRGRSPGIAGEHW